MIDTLLDNGWSYHADEPKRLADELEALDFATLTAADIRKLLLLSNHVMGEHLSQWSRARKIAEQVVREGSKSSENWALLATCRYMDGDKQAAVKAQLQCVQAASDAPLAAIVNCKMLIAKALLINQQAEVGLPFLNAIVGTVKNANVDAETNRKMAIDCHSIANHLLPLNDRSELLSSALLQAATASLYFWQKCGKWRNVERGLYLIQIIQNQLFQHQKALDNAEKALKLIDENGGEPVDEAFIRLEIAKSHKAMGNQQLHAIEITKADNLAITWDDTVLYDLYMAEKAKG